MSSGDESVRRGRPVKGSELVEGLEASAGARLRLKLVLQTLSGSTAIAEACRELGIGESRFHVLRRQALAAAAAGLEPSPAGRPPKPRPEDDPERESLRRELQMAKLELQAGRIREQIAIAMPGPSSRRPPGANSKTCSGASGASGRRAATP